MDKHKKNISFIVISAVIGFMIAIQFQTVKKPVERDTRDLWQLREALLQEKELQSELLTEIRSNEEKLLAYESKLKHSKEQALVDTIQELKIEAGMTNVQGPGLTLRIEPVLEGIQIGEPVSSVSPELLKRLLNELNMYNAKYVSVDDQRIINTTVIRDINNETKIDGHALSSLPIEVKVAVDSKATAEKLYNQMKVSKATEEFFIENLKLTILEPNPEVTIPAYNNPIRIRYLESLKTSEGGNT
ncbi:DUF881 domain-containing protein [Bacillus sp. OK048]|uniref:DUF881 domain-containing protein n=1 Tax=Bacillus sp. OK048 TaxID=1882761 RepID=UPI00088D2FD0|nr:DUF881 domain-containing protein [Bacillus sp. OK048]SDM03759.1 Uncharacterized conserved protein YlxW, UPF0749 family [Bacillus sp. OK048]